MILIRIIAEYPLHDIELKHRVKQGGNPGRGGHLGCQASLELLMELGGVIWKRVEAVDRYVSCICIYV